MMVILYGILSDFENVYTKGNSIMNYDKADNLSNAATF